MRGGAVIDRALEGLTAPQREAAMHVDGPLLVLAGPGSGKTRVITRRIAHLIGSGIPAWQIMALTFTNKAAAEMRERVDKFFGIREGEPNRATRGLTVTTFHSLGARLIRKYAEQARAQMGGLTPTFTIFDTSDQTATLKKALEQLNLSTANWPPRSVLSRISHAKNELIDAEAFAAQATEFQERTVAKIYERYQRLMRAANAADFDDLLVLTARVLRENAAVREECRERWQYLLIDEYQDTNRAQFMIASMLAGVGVPAIPTDPAQANAATPPPPPLHNICVVGDPDQSIYGWRGADITNILQFEKVFPKSKVIALGKNFRSTARIISAADTLIRNNTQRKHKDLFTSNMKGEKVEIVACRDEHHEASLVMDWLKRLKSESESGSPRANPSTEAQAPLSWKDMAVFYRTNALSRVMEDQLRNHGIPYVIARGTAFYDREEVKNALAYLRVVANPLDDVSLGRIINTPARGIGDTTIEKIEQWAAHNGGVPLFEALKRAPAAIELPARTVNAISKFVSMVEAWRGEDPDAPLLGSLAGSSLGDLVDRVVRESGLESMYRSGKTEEDAQRIENLAEVVSSAREFEQNYEPESDPAIKLGEVAASSSADVDESDNLAALADADGELIDNDTPSSIEGDSDDFDPLYVEALDQPSVHDLLRSYIERVTLVSDSDAIDPSLGAVTLMTLHAAKGLEFPVVAMIGLEEGCLPHSRGLESPAELEEERRLCFVGITRAMRRLLMTSSRYRTVRGVPERTIPSRFIDELPKDDVTIADQAGWNEPGWDDAGEGNRDRVEWGKSSYDFSRRGGVSSGGGGSSRGASGDRSLGGIQIGVKVRHPQFGIGTVKSVTPGAGARAQIQFREAGVKTLVLEYARLEVIPT